MRETSLGPAHSHQHSPAHMPLHTSTEETGGLLFSIKGSCAKRDVLAAVPCNYMIMRSMHVTCLERLQQAAGTAQG